MGLIRLLLALSVVMAHSWQFPGFKMISAQYSVELFFLISGFYMALVLNTKYKARLSGNRDFWLNRLIRIFPTYWLIVVVSVVVALIGQQVPYWGDKGHWANLQVWSAIALLFVNALLLFQDVVMFTGVGSTGALFWTAAFRAVPTPGYLYLIVPQAWSISLELMFYALAPFIVRSRIRLMVGLVVASLLARVMLARYGLFHDPWSYRFFPSELAFFLVGAISCRIGVIDKRIELPRLMGWAGLAILPLLIVFHGYWVSLVGHVLPPKAALFIVLISTFLCLGLFMPAIFDLTKRNALDRLIGDFSYPVYMTHVFVFFGLGVASEAFRLPGLVRVGTPYGLVATLILSAVLVFALDRPLDAYRQNRLRALPAVRSSKESTVVLG